MKSMPSRQTSTSQDSAGRRSRRRLWGEIFNLVVAASRIIASGDSPTDNIRTTVIRGINHSDDSRAPAKSE